MGAQDDISRHLSSERFKSDNSMWYSSTFQLMVMAETVVMNVYSWINPFLLLASSSIFRNHLVAFVLRRQVVDKQFTTAAKGQTMAPSRFTSAIKVAWPPQH